MKEFEYLGFNSVSLVRDKKRVSSYVLKYITKDFFNLEKNSHCYFRSQGLKSPEIVYSQIENESLMKLKYNFENEYCKIMYTNDITNILQNQNNIDF